VIAAAMRTATTSTTSNAMRVLRFMPRRAGFAGAGGSAVVVAALPLPAAAGVPEGSVFGSLMTPPRS
jgi:hypothetical protein